MFLEKQSPASGRSSGKYVAGLLLETFAKFWKEGQEKLLQHLQPWRDRAPSTSTGTSSGSPLLSSARSLWKEDLQWKKTRGKGLAELSAVAMSPSPLEPLQLHKGWPALTVWEARVESPAFKGQDPLSPQGL